jgi:beta-mannosidase
MEVLLKNHSQILFKNSYPLYNHCSRQMIALENVDFWWPKGYGDAVLYEATVRIIDENKKVLDEKVQKIGIRTAELIFTDLTTQEKPGEFLFKINGEKIFVRGTNWVPLDALHSRDKNHLKDAFTMINDLNCNMIRCWGGNVYEDQKFYDLCDENGIMVWQDFSFAGTVYPQDSEFAEKVRNEAINVVLKLRPHPSLVLWCGNNEIDISIGWIFSKPINPSLDRISRDVLPRVVWEYDPIRTYLPSSPYCSEELFKQGNKISLMPQVHLWGPRGYYKTPFYTDVNAHFVAEIGYHGCPNRSSLEKMFNPESVYPWTKSGEWNDEWQTKAVSCHPNSTLTIDRNNLMIRQVYALFGDTLKDLDQFIFASQVVQAEAMKFFIELWRMEKFRKTGIIWWNLRDGWPIISDAVVDYYNSKKLAYYYIRQVQYNNCVMIGDPKSGTHPVVAVNDTREASSGKVMIRDADSGKQLFSRPFNIPANGKTVIGTVPSTSKQAMWLIEYTIGDKKYTNHYLAGKAPFKLADYNRWYSKLNITRE